MRSLEAYGEALFGARWQTDLASHLGISDRTMRRWVTEPEGMPDGAWDDIRDLCAKRGEKLLQLAEA
jgi:hypothetical protein